MKSRRAFMLAMASLPVIVPAFATEAYSTRPIEVIVPWGPGGGADVLGRILAHWLEKDLKTSCEVLNFAGASGMIGLGRMINQPPDGQTVGILTSDSLMMAASGAPGFKFSDATTLAVLMRQPSGMFVPTGSKYKTWQDVVNAGKTKPGGVTVAITGAMTADDLTVRYLASKNVTLTAVPYTKPGERYQGVVAGHVEMLYEQAGDIRNFLDSGQMRPLLFFATKRLPPPFADVPVSAEFGYDVLLPQSRAVLAKAGTDPHRLALLKASIDRFATSSEYLKFLDQQLALPDSFMPAQQAQPFLQGEHEVMRKLIATYVKS